ncbi:MAG: PfkB family carbohydrate kinase [Chloroflexota bacterium]
MGRLSAEMAIGRIENPDLPLREDVLGGRFQQFPGGKGALLVRNDFPSKAFKPLKVDVVDTTAAIDSFAAVLAVGIAEKLPIIDAVDQANAAGALAVTKMGAQPSIPARREVQDLLETRRNEKEVPALDNQGKNKR